MYRLEFVNQSGKEYVNGQTHTNGMESFWAGLKRDYHGTIYHLSAKQSQRHVNENAGRQTIREQATLDQMAVLAKGFVAKRLQHRGLVA